MGSIPSFNTQCLENGRNVGLVVSWQYSFFLSNLLHGTRQKHKKTTIKVHKNHATNTNIRYTNLFIKKHEKQLFRKLILLHSVSHFPRNFRDIACWVAVLNAAHCLAEQWNGNNLIIPPSANRIQNRSIFSQTLPLRYNNLYLWLYILNYKFVDRFLNDVTNEF